MCFKRFILLILLPLLGSTAFAQTCPGNVGFEDGALTGWVCYTGTLETSGTQPPVWDAGGAPTPGRHTIIQNSSPQVLDPYGNFPINSPNGSKYSLMLGNSGVRGGGGGYCERATYDFTVPSDDFTLIYYYAVVFQNPKDHDDNQQPKFIANVINKDNPADTPCGSFAFTASAGLDGFRKASYGSDIYYKAWSPITIRITGHKGGHFQLEFITRDCSKGGHFGYAYVDFNENCASPITGNNYCSGTTDAVTLTAPAGFQNYEWFDANGTSVGTAPTLKLSPIPAEGTIYSLHIVPYTGLGCENTFKAIIHKVDAPFNLQTQKLMQGCKLTGIDLTQASVTQGSTGITKFEYYTDPDGQNFLSDPKFVTQTGDYYIRGSNDFGCTDIAMIHLDLLDGPPVTTTAPQPVCAPQTVNLSKCISSNEAGVTFNYYSDAALTNKVPNYQAVTQSGRYYIKVTSTNPNECIASYYFDVIVSTLPQVKDLVYGSCPPLDLAKAVNSADGSGLIFSYYTDAQGKQPVTDPAKILNSGTYYYQAFNQYGCSGNIAAINATVYPLPVFKVTDPMPVVFPETINLDDTHPAYSYAAFTYWRDAACTVPLENYQNLDGSGTFYIKATNTTGCIDIEPVHVIVNEPPEIDVVVGNTFTPNGDGVNDEFKPQMQGVGRLDYIKIFNRYGRPVYQINALPGSWDGTFDGKPEPTGTYYWMFSAYDIYRKKTVRKAGSITILR